MFIFEEAPNDCSFTAIPKTKTFRSKGMKRFTYILFSMGALFALASLVLQIISFNPLRFQSILTSDGAFDSLALYAFQGIRPGLLLGGGVLLLIGLFLYLNERGTLPLYRWPVRRFLTFIISLQVLCSLVYILILPFELSGDSEWYLRQAHNLAAGNPVATAQGELTAFWPIGYPVIIAVFYRIFGPALIVAQILNIPFLAGITLLTYALGRQLFDPRNACRAALLLSLMPSQIFYSIMPLADIPFSFLVLLLIYLLNVRQSWKTVLLAGLVFGLAMLIKPVIIFFPVFYAVYRFWRDRRWRPVLLRAAMIVILGELILLPWQIRNARVFDTFVLVSNNGGYNLWMGNNPNSSGGVLPETFYIQQDTLRWMYQELSEAERDRYASIQGITYIKTHPFRALALWPKKFLHLFVKDSKCITYAFTWNFEKIPAFVLMGFIILTEGYYYVLGLAFLLAWPSFWRFHRFSGPFWIISGITVCLVLVYLPFIAEGRYHMPLMPLFAIVIANYRNAPRNPEKQ
jgi:hypothetical protein